MKSGLAKKSMLIFLLAQYCLLQSTVYADDENVFNQAQAAFEQKNYQQAQQLFSQLDSVESYFAEGTACYRMQDYFCAQQAFAAAAWATEDKIKRAKAVFNLANSYFFLADYDQAIVLYRDAELLGINSVLIATNLSYAKSMQSAILRNLKLISQGYQRALWKAAASGEKTPSFSEFVSNNENFLSIDFLQNLQQSEYRVSTQNIQNEILRQLGVNNEAVQKTSGKWIETDRVLPQSSAKIMNRLFEMELDIPAQLSMPQTVEGKRKW